MKRHNGSGIILYFIMVFLIVIQAISQLFGLFFTTESKALPDVSQFFRGDENETDPQVELLLGMDDYISNTLREAYKYSREKLENISDMERAWNYLVNSDYRFLAVCCFIIAVFLDAAAFLVGLYIYANKNEKKKPKSTVESVSDDDSSTDGVNA